MVQDENTDGYHIHTILIPIYQVMHDALHEPATA